MTCTCGETTVDSFSDDCPYLTASYIFAGLSMMLNIRLAYSSAPYALIRFRLPENLFSVFVRRMASALELWCLPSMLLGNIMDVAMKLSAKPKDDFKLDHSKQQDRYYNNKKLGRLILMKHWKFLFIIIPSIMTMWSDFLTYVILLIVYIMGDQGNVTAYYGVIAVSGFIFGINMTLVYAADWRYIPVYIAGENAFPMLTSIMHYITTLIFGNRRKWNSDFLIVTIDICVAIIISFTTATLWTSAYHIMNHKSPDKILRFGVLPGQFFTDPYGTTRNTSVTFDVTLGRSGGSGFQSSGTITITVGAADFTALKSPSGNKVEITLSTGGTIKKCVNGKLEEIKGGTGETLPENTKLEINATGTITEPSCEVTIKATLDVTSEGDLSKPLNLAADPKDPSSQGLSGTITPQSGSTSTVEIKTGDKITLTGAALKALHSLTKNAVTLSGTSSNFRSNASIIVTRTSGAVDLSKLTVSEKLEITSISGTIRNSDGNTDLQTGTPLTAGTKLSLNAIGSITKPPDANGTPVNIAGTIVVTNKDKQQMGNTLTFAGGPGGSGVSGSLSLQNQSSPTPKYVKITGSGSKIEINNKAYTTIQTAADTTETFFTIGAADPRDINTHKPAIEKGTDGYDLATDEKYFQNYWQLLPPNNYDSSLPYWTSISPALMIMVGMGFVYCIYPGIAPGMIVPFYLVDKIETVLLVLTTFPPVIVAILRKHKKEWSPTYFEFPAFKKWYEYPAGQFYLSLNILMVIKMTLLGIFIYCMHYRDSHISRSIVNQPKMSTFLSIVFYMCHECLLALGFSGFIGNNGGDFILIPQYIGALLMIFLAFYSEGYIIEYKSHDPAHWPTEGMTWWNVVCNCCYLSIIS